MAHTFTPCLIQIGSKGIGDGLIDILENVYQTPIKDFILSPCPGRHVYLNREYQNIDRIAQIITKYIEVFNDILNKQDELNNLYNEFRTLTNNNTCRIFDGIIDTAVTMREFYAKNPYYP